MHLAEGEDAVLLPPDGSYVALDAAPAETARARAIEALASRTAARNRSATWQ